ncbi:MAG: hypothetical protein UX85_C0001G0195 [Candidatus Beckwithbacteria bacterium GW2011_GWB1_47_15]|uniref:Uncharacterized protein n=1 Tax=Candidatus Beckwithbacteria bacterium GW2011_GWB1_47_15 TaxID=1618371 RepID=A0A0G1RXZ3_9BACT|nr:MAG: hypothetical protein UY43_C0001G0930 [Candidatus Beckwithbacteria bacterium GW2011_GWC1_49_16]AQS30832.1 hypothetical protein [uncultured bacterium]KKU36017.1 MAG: hypothetical protein UX50_C0001G0194 [Candidatus Beckwithbacteria bacterium GW2011_GWA1_46_30]KKU61981.1 MAG: hypothetical protein UX85_C0001G0195 [Candidatus Beckwithbacteria bacterium GW2011_GWB1_47_15]KKU72465.1 MAG: hypothetical protein UX97_C0001G0335 [Candidatus Beckwithbacteria bacterium GW2011_GWA2_47_25]KKW04368.1 M
MKRYLKLYWEFFKNCLVREMEFRAHFIFSNLVSLSWALLFILTFILIYQHVDTVNGWARPQVLLLLAVYFLADRIFDTFFEINFANFVSLVNSGELDLVLTKPASGQFIVSLRYLSLSFLVSVIAMLALIVYLIKTYFWPVSMINLLVFIFLIVIGITISYALWFMTLLPVFWWGRVENINHLFRSFHQLARIPLDLTGPILRPLLTYLLPLMFIATVPVKSITGAISWPLAFFGLFAAALLLWLSGRAWRFALRHYTSASS